MQTLKVETDDIKVLINEDLFKYEPQSLEEVTQWAECVIFSGETGRLTKQLKQQQTVEQYDRTMSELMDYAKTIGNKYIQL